MSRRRLDKLESSLSPKEAVIHWLTAAHAFGSLPAYAASLIDQPEATQPFIALPAQVETAIYGSMRSKRPGFIKEVMREASGDTIFLLRLVIGLNVHIEETLRTERLRHVALYWWSRALDTRSEPNPDARSDWERGASTLRGELSGTERSRATAEARYLDGHDSLFPELAAEWGALLAVADGLIDGKANADEEPTREEAEQRVQRIVQMARADGLDASGKHGPADAMAKRVVRLQMHTTEATDG